MVHGLKGMKLNVPRAVRVGHSVTLVCDYDLEEAPLYSVKWYQGTNEFYRYVPKEEPPTRVFPIPGLLVDVSLIIRYKFISAISFPLSQIVHH